MKGLGEFLGAFAVFLVAAVIWPVGCGLVVKTGTAAVTGFLNQPFWLLLLEALAFCAGLQFSSSSKGEK